MMMLAVQQHYALPPSWPLAAILAAAVAGLAFWVLSHKLQARARWLAALLIAGRWTAAIAGCWLLIQGAMRWLLFSTDWPLWIFAVLAVAAIEVTSALYRLERQTIPRRKGLLLAGLRLAAVTLVVLMIAQPVRSWDLSQRFQRYLAVLVDDSASMLISDTQLSISDKVRLAQRLRSDLPKPKFQLHDSCRGIQSLIADIKMQADSLAPLEQAGADVRQKQLLDRRKSLRAAMEQALSKLATQQAAVDAPLKDATWKDPAGGKGGRAALQDAGVRLSAKVRQALTAAQQIVDDKNTEQLGPRCTQLLQHLRGAAADLVETLPVLEQVSVSLDEAYYASLAKKDQQAIDQTCSQSRLELARQLLTQARTGQKSMLDDLGKYNLRIYSFASDVRQIDAGALRTGPIAATMPASPPAAGGPVQTDLAAAVRKVAMDLGQEKLAGLVILSDGRHNAKESVEQVTRQMGLQQVPICSILMGSTRPPTDAAIVAIEAPDTIYAKDKMFLSADVKLDGLGGKTVKVQLTDGQKVVDAKDVQVPQGSSAYRTHVELGDTPEKVGLHSYQVSVQSFEGEAFADNNAYGLTLNVTDDQARVLLIDGRPRYEFGFLKNLFDNRDKTVRLQYVLTQAVKIEDGAAALANQRPPASASRPANDTEAGSLPATEAEWMKFDVVVLGDVEPAVLTKAQQENLRRFVVDRGGTLIVIAGQDCMPQAYTSSPLAEILPVMLEADSLAARTVDGPYHVALTDEGRQSVIMRQDVDSKANLTAWANFEPIYRRYACGSVKAGASILAYALPPSPPAYMADSSAPGTAPAGPSVADDQTQALRRQFQNTHALIVTQNVGLGQVMYLGMDHTWRLRYRIGDKYHHQFWGQVLRWATASKLPAGTSLVKLGTDRVRYAPHQAIGAKARLLKSDFSPLVSSSVAVKVYRDKQLVLTRNLSYAGDTPGMYAGSLGELPSGTYRMELSAPEAKPLMEQDHVSVVATEFSVDPSAPAEQVELSADPTLLSHLGQLTGGRCVYPYDAPLALEPLAEPTLSTHRIRQVTLWDSWWLLSLIMVLITSEWLLRKKVGLA